MKSIALASRLLSTCALFALGGSWASAQLQTIYSEGFEPPLWANGQALTGTPVNGWTGNNTPGSGNSVTVQVSNEQAAPGGSQSLFLSDNSTTAAATATYIFEQNYANGSIAFDFRRNQGIAFAVRFFDTDKSAKNFDIVIGDLNNVNGFHIRNSSDVIIGQVSFSSIGYSFGNEWMSVRVLFDNDSHTASLFLDDRVDPVLSVPDSGVNWQIGKIMLVAGANSATGMSGYFDNIELAVQIPESSTYTLLLSLLAIPALVVYRRRGSR